MSLNIDLEDVPFAILEAVKARILANRRKLQDQQQRPRPSLRPRPQFAKIGATSKIWRLPKPAAMVEDDSRVLLVTWSGIQPVLSDSGAVLLYQELDPSSTATTITAGSTVAAVGVSGTNNASYWTYETAQSSVNGGSDFTYEAWVQFVSSRQSMAVIRLADSDGFAMEMRFLYTDGSLYIAEEGTYFNIADPIDGYYPAPINGSTSGPPFQSKHICMMRKDGIFYWAIDGVIFTVSPSEEAKALVLTGNTKIDFGIFADGNSSPNKLSQLRLDPDRARYSISGFTPDPLPFTE